MWFDPGFDIEPDYRAMTFRYGPDTFGPMPERRHLDDIRQSLRDPCCTGPEIPYIVSMDVGRMADRTDLIGRNLLYGAMIYADGTLGSEPVRSQGHVHAVSVSCGCSTPEVYEVWDGEAVIYMQESAQDQPGSCYAVHAKPGQVVVVPPAWAHCTVNADPSRPMAFGAWCVRDYGFDYADVRRHGGLAYFPEVRTGGLSWVHNDAYEPSPLILREARGAEELGLTSGMSIYEQYERDHELFRFVTDPQTARDIWAVHEP